MDEKTMMNEIKFLVNKYVSQEQTKAEKKCNEIESNMRVLETLPLVKSLRERIAYLEKELDVYRSKEQPKSPSDWGNVLMQVDERVVIDLCDTVSEKDDDENDNDDDDEVKNQIVQETHVHVDDQPESSSENDRASVQTDDVDEGVDVESVEEDDEVEGENKEISLCKNTDCVAEKNDDYSESCNVCDGYFNDGLNDILFIEEEPNNKKASCDLCKETNNIVQMKGTGQYMCQNACDEEEEEEVKAEEEEEEVEAEEEEEEVEAEEEEEEVEAEEEEEEAEEEEEEVEEEEEEEEVEVFEHIIDGKTYYVTSLTNGEIFDVDDDEFENPVGTIKNGKVTMTM